MPSIRTDMTAPERDAHNVSAVDPASHQSTSQQNITTTSGLVTTQPHDPP
jgi:hypothetical protein